MEAKLTLFAESLRSGDVPQECRSLYSALPKISVSANRVGSR